MATFRLARRIAKDPVTARSGRRSPVPGPSGHAEVAEEVREHGGVKHAVGELLTCPFCLAQWVGTGFVFGYVTAPKATRLAALTMTMVAGSDVLQFAYDAIQTGVPPLGDDEVVQADAGRPACRRPLRGRGARRPATGRPALSCDLDPGTGRRRRRVVRSPGGKGAACDRSGAGPCRSASSASP